METCVMPATKGYVSWKEPKVSTQPCALGKSQYSLLMVLLRAVINSTKNCNPCIWRCDYNTCLNCFYLTGWGTYNVMDSAQCWMSPPGTINPVPPQLCHWLGQSLAPLGMLQSCFDCSADANTQPAAGWKLGVVLLSSEPLPGKAGALERNWAAQGLPVQSAVGFLVCYSSVLFTQ